MSTRPNLVLAVVAGLVVVLAVLAGLLTARREPPALDLATPEGTVQTYVLAVTGGDDEAAVALLDPELGCKVPLNTYRPERASIAVVGTKISGERATVTLDITEYGTGLLDSWSHREVFELISQDSGWIITGTPWPVYSCK